MTTILLLHGIPGSALTWQRVIPLLEPHYEVLAPELLGFGGPGGDVTGDDLLAPNQARHVLDMLDARSIDRVVLVGHDFGGPVAAHIAAMAPERVTALALFATNAFPDSPIPFPLSLLDVPLIGSIAERLLFSRVSLGMMVKRGMGQPKPPVDLNHYLGDARQVAAIRSIFAASLRRIVELYAPVQEALGSVAVPAVVGWGDRDPFFAVTTGERTAELISGAQFRLYEGAGHFLPAERPQEIAADVLALVAHVES
jgi:pimeloyl-ACP methyl ester carboxylesterase